ncbi:hypothetical protein N6B72_21955 [Chryseobacterium soli]|uniref:hypothetical protein n=1 Tax=Chryseobacterium soli TaxID=445961 RepID=UPI002954420E|nr:hypothetical protein [Chryseobacterium soli]MDV7699584.1 hypothetical protein [Chryseobacterium soli]
MKNNYVKFLIFITIGFVIITILYPIILSFFISSSQEKGVFGDSFGALNTFFSALALSGVIVSIFMQQNEMDLQREEMNLQRVEMTSSRYEYKHNRITNLLYWQLEKFEKSLESFKINYITDTPSGNTAINFLDKELKYIRNYKEDKKEQLDDALSQKHEILNNLYIITSSKDEIISFIISSYNCISTLNSILNTSDLLEEDKKELRSIFLNNVGIVIPSVLETIGASIHFSGKFFRELQVDNNQFTNLSNLMNIFIYIDDVIEFFKNKN